jgi:hypothetical protein
MIDFKKREGSDIPPEDTKTKIPSKEEVQRFFEEHFKKNVDEYVIYKKNQFKNPNKEIIKDLMYKLESFIKSESSEENGELIKLIFSNIQNNIQILINQNLLPKNEKNVSFLTSFLSSKFFS